MICKFEGNANGFKILTESKIGSPGGLRLSYATLGALQNTQNFPCPMIKQETLRTKNMGSFQIKRNSSMMLLVNWD